MAKEAQLSVPRRDIGRNAVAIGRFAPLGGSALAAEPFINDGS